MSRIKEIKERCEKATKGPWKYELNMLCGRGGKEVTILSPTSNRADKALISNAREDIPFLLDLNADLLAALEGLYPFCHENKMEGESDFERAWLKAEAAIDRAKGES